MELIGDKCLKSYIEYKCKLESDWEKAYTIIETFDKMDFPKSNENGAHIASIDCMFHWDNRPVVVTIHDANFDYVMEVLKTIRQKYGCFWKREVWETIQKVIYSTQINGTNVYVQLISGTECEWKEKEKYQLTQYELVCSE